MNDLSDPPGPEPTPKPDSFIARTASRMPVRGFRQGVAFAGEDWVADEVPVALEFNGVSHAVMLATPADLKDFALGFSLSEGILDHPSQLFSCDEERAPAGISLHLRIAGSAFARLKERRRTLAGRTGCGLCGAESLSQVSRALPRLPERTVPGWSGVAVARAMAQLGEHQVLQQHTGATHAAAWCSAAGEVLCLREDVGRHNAMDKLIGALASGDEQDARTLRDGFIAITSRASFEMVQKAVTARVGLLAAVSAPTSMAVKLAAQAGLTLVGFARGDDLVVYGAGELPLE